MSLERLLNQGKLEKHKTSKQEIDGLFELVKRDIKDAKVNGLSADRRFATAYNAVLQLATIILYCKGYRSKGTGHHFTVFQALTEILGAGQHERAEYFDSCRSKRNVTDYSRAGDISEAQAGELITEAEDFLAFTLKWLHDNYPALI